MTETAPSRPWLRPVLIGLGIVAVAGLVMSFLLFGRWTDVIDARQAAADSTFTAAITAAGGGRPYIEIDPDGTVLVHRELESSAPRGFGSLSMLAWSPGDEKMLRMEFPHWFVRAKTATSFNLGTIVAFWRHDWDQINLSISYADLRRRGPALLLDNRLPNGARIVLWTTEKGS